MATKKVVTPAIPDGNEVSAIDPKSKTLKVQTANDTYEIKKPGGKLGGKHFCLLTKAMPKNQLQEDGDNAPGMSPADQERLQEVFVDWIEQILPHILVKSHNNPDLKPEEIYDELPGEDQWVLYLASFKLMNVSGELFRIVN